MAEEPARIPRLGWAIAFICVTVALAATWGLLKGIPPANTKAPEPIATVPSFEFTAQDGRKVSLDDLLGKVWVCTFIFTRCAGPCPMITSRMAELNRIVSERRGDVRLVSVSVDPEHDTPAVLSDYAKNAGADPSRWMFLTGKPGDIETFVVKGMLQPLMTEPGAPPMHSQRFVVVGRDGNIRTYHDLNEPELIQKLVMDIGVLLREAPPKGHSSAEGT